jgi:hypothetical protein
MTNSCFIGNSFKQYAIIELYNNGIFTSERNYADEKSLGNVKCALGFAESTPDSLDSIECTDFTEETCILDAPVSATSDGDSDSATGTDGTLTQFAGSRGGSGSSTSAPSSSSSRVYAYMYSTGRDTLAASIIVLLSLMSM